MNYFYSNKALLFLAISSFVCTAVQASQPDNPRPTKRRKLSSNQEQLENPHTSNTKALSPQQSLAQHKREEHKCTHPGCERTFSRKSSMNRHVKAIHEGQQVQCTHPGCPKNFSSKSNMKKHVKAQHKQDHAQLRSSTKRNVPSEQPDQHSLDIATIIASLSNSNSDALQELAQEKDTPVTMIDLFPFPSF